MSPLRRRACWRRALMSRPRLLLLDEPSTGLAPLVSGRFFQILRELTARG